MSDREVKIVVFDLYDTLISARESSIRNVLHVLRAHNNDWTKERPTLAIPTEQALRRHYGASSKNPERGPIEDWLTAVWGEDDADTAQTFSKYFRKTRHSHPYMFRAIDGANECLDYLAAEQYIVMLATGASPESIDQRLEEAEINPEYFNMIFARDIRNERGRELIIKKPDPAFFDNFLRWTSRQKVFPGQCLYVGDHYHDAMAALGAGMRFVGVLTGVATEEEEAAREEEFLRAEVRKENIIKSVKYLPDRLRKGDIQNG